jgi:hypothetical protein
MYQRLTPDIRLQKWSPGRRITRQCLAVVPDLYGALTVHFEGRARVCRIPGDHAPGRRGRGIWARRWGSVHVWRTTPEALRTQPTRPEREDRSNRGAINIGQGTPGLSSRWTFLDPTNDTGLSKNRLHTGDRIAARKLQFPRPVRRCAQRRKCRWTTPDFRTDTASLQTGILDPCSLW